MATSQLYIFLIFLILSIFGLIWVRRKHFFQLTTPQETVPSWSSKQLLCVGLVAIAAFLIPSLIWFVWHLNNPDIVEISNAVVIGWIQITTLISIGLVTSLFLLTLGKEQRQRLFWPFNNPTRTPLRPFFYGMATIALAWPLAQCVSQLVGWLLEFIPGYSMEQQQTVVQELEQLRSTPLLYSLNIILVVTLVPWIEEIFFRGFLHSWLRSRFTREMAIFLCATLFTLAHYESTQGMFNAQLLASVFVLALFLSLLYEKYRSLWAPIGLHVANNLFNAILLIAGIDNV